MSTVLYPSPVFGPVTSRRLGRSLGVNLSPADGKVCSFDCIYCECGLNAERLPKTKPPKRETVARELEARLQKMAANGETIDAITYSGNGEPTSHPDFLNVVKDTCALRDKYFPNAKVCLLTNATHLAKPEIFEAVQLIDRPCLKLDTVDRDYIDYVDRPNCPYHIEDVIEKMRELGQKAVIQTMFMKGEYQGKSVDNTTEKYVGPWVEAVAKIAPMGVDMYTLARDTPVTGLKKVSKEELEAIADRLRIHGINVHTFG